MLLTIVLNCFAASGILCAFYAVRMYLVNKYHVWNVVNISSPVNRNPYSTKWPEIENLSNTYNSCPLAVIYANNLLEQALKERGYKQEKIAQKISSVTGIFTKKKQIWKAIELRNKIAHSIDMKSFTKEAMQEALQSYRQALVDIRVLQ